MLQVQTLAVVEAVVDSDMVQVGHTMNMGTSVMDTRILALVNVEIDDVVNNLLHITIYSEITNSREFE
jgi:hypothetical protein